MFYYQHVLPSSHNLSWQITINVSRETAAVATLFFAQIHSMAEMISLEKSAIEKNRERKWLEKGIS